MKISKEVKIGIFVFSMLLALYWGMNFLNKNKALRSTSNYYIVFNAAEGLEHKSPVFINGVNIGRVSQVSLGAENNVIVGININRQLKLPIGTVACITSGRLLDKKNISLTLSNSNSFYQPNDTIAAASCGNDIFSSVVPIAERVDSLITQFSELLVSLNSAIDQQNQDNLKKSLHNISKLSDNLNQMTSGLNRMIGSNEKNIEVLTSSLSKSSENLKLISENLKNSNQQISSLIANADSTFSNTNKLSGTLRTNAEQGKLLSIMQQDSLYINLTRTIRNLDGLINDIHSNPKDYVSFSIFGGKKKSK
ncbi:MAG: MlaD family protein [Prevotellaceae bacterium]|jgi:phospholipid/cholesterol/gamma-HCH transport system substrate-binding protein|nr:MlaD family protein [Prevotellaceae bacterium]